MEQATINPKPPADRPYIILDLHGKGISDRYILIMKLYIDELEKKTTSKFLEDILKRL